MSYRTLATVVSVDGDRHPLILPDGCATGGEVAALRASGYNPRPGDRCMVTKVGMRFVAEYAVDGALSAGLSAYEVAVANGFTGSETEWLASLQGAAGAAGAAGASAYQVAVANGFTGTQAEWLQSLKGEPGEGLSLAAGRFTPFVCDFLCSSPYANAPLFGYATGNGYASDQAGDANHIGVVSLMAGSNGYSGYRFSGSGSAMAIAGGEVCEVIFNLYQIQNIQCKFGFHNSTGHGTVFYGVCLYIWGSSSSPAAYTLLGRVVTPSAQYDTATSYAPTRLTWYRARIEVNADATQVNFSLCGADGTPLWSGSVTCDVTAVGLVTPSLMATYADGGARIVDLDWAKFEINRDLTR